MKLKVRGEEEIDEPTIRFWLEEVGGEVRLRARMDDGFTYIILTIDEHGFSRNPGCTGCGLPLDSGDRVSVR